MARAETLVDLLDGLLDAPRPDLLRVKRQGRWQNISTAEFVAGARALARFLIDRGVAPGDRVALLSENRPEWSQTDFGILAAGAVGVPIYATLLGEQVSFIVRDSGARIAFVSTPAQYEKLRMGLEQTGLETVVVFDPAKPPGAWVVSLEEALAAGRAADRAQPSVVDARKKAVRPDNLATVIYTSGTTGEPKGVMLTHRNFTSNVESVLGLIPMARTDVGLSFLPLSHVFERTVEYCYFRLGCCLAYAESIEAVRENLLEIRPTVCAAVPRLFEKTRTRILDTVREGSSFRRALFGWALGAGRRKSGYTLEGKRPPLLTGLRAAVADRLVFSKIRGRLGGRLRFFISGGAPLARDLGEFFECFGVTILEGYGLTETSPVIALNTPDHRKLGTVGRVIPEVEVKIAEDGEILARGPNIMKGYWNKPEATVQALEEGWFHTGDIGFLDAEGYLLITDRKKDLLVTSAGKNVAPQPIENALKSSRFIANAVCIGDRRNFIAALIVPEMDALRSWAREKGIAAPAPGEGLRAFLDRAELQSLIGREIERTTERFAPYERVKRFHLLERDFSIDDGEMTPTLKVKRRVVLSRYAAAIDRLYA